MDDEYSLVSFVAALEEAGALDRLKQPVSLRSVAAIAEEHDNAVLFERIAGSDMPLLVNAMASRRCWSVALGTSERQVREELSRRAELLGLGKRTVTTGPVKELVFAGDDVDLTRLPVHLHHRLDGAPYISASMDVSRRHSGYNLGMRRLMLRGARETGIDAVAPTDLRAEYRAARERGEQFPIAFVIGCHPLDYLSSQLPVPATDEYEVMSALRGAPVPLVPCETVPLEVPADAEMVLEGFLEGDWTEAEGPFGEYTGCYGLPHRNPLFKVTAMTCRREPLFQTATIGGRRLAHTDTALLSALTTEFALWEAVRRAIAQPREVYCPPAATGLHHARISIQVRDPGDARNTLLAALGSRANIKLAIVVDEDIDITSDELVEWAVATRYQADRDTVVASGMRTLPLDPSLPPRDGTGVTGAKLGMDATCRLDRPREIFSIPEVPFPEVATEPVRDGPLPDIALHDICAAMLDTAREGARFADWLAVLPDVLHADVLHALEKLRSDGLVELRMDGRYWPAPAAARPPWHQG